MATNKTYPPPFHAATVLRHTFMKPREIIVPGCACSRCNQRRLVRKRRKAMRLMGRPMRVHPHEFQEAVAKLRDFRNRGMTRHDMEVMSGLNNGSFADWINEQNGTMLRSSYDKIMAMRYGRPVSALGTRVSACGTTRRMQALRCAGWPTRTVLAPMLGVESSAVGRMSAGTRKFVFYETREAVRVLYDKLINVDPVEYGVRTFDVQRVKAYAEKAGCVPAHCWDEDTIDDPDAFPEFTGACGTVRGYRIHLVENIRMRERKTHSHRREVLCQPCKDAVAANWTAQGRWNKELILSHIRAGLTIDEIIDRVGCSPNTVTRIRKANP